AERRRIVATWKEQDHILTRKASASCLLQANASHCGAMLHAGFFLRFMVVCIANHPHPPARKAEYSPRQFLQERLKKSKKWGIGKGYCSFPELGTNPKYKIKKAFQINLSTSQLFFPA
ncbi:MAG: hypothetical protein IJY46_03860, partial [Lentisphaeria bacterium]|nr:hypothetical protein [Lentisphaeria bacterium]